MNLTKGTILAVDPGLRYPAAALFIDGRLLVASRVKVPGSLTKEPIGERMRRVARLILEWTTHLPHTVVCEYPQVYVTARSKGDPNDLLPLVGIGMHLAGLLDVPVLCPTPAEWLGGNSPKSTTGDPWTSVRGQCVARRLDAEERSRVTPSHDAIDAVGIGLWAVGRFERIQVLAGSTPG